MSRPKIRAITDKADIVRAVEYINKIEFTSSFAVEPAAGWTCLIRFYDSSHSSSIFGISKTNDSGIKHNNRFYVTDKFKPFWDFIDG